MDLVPLMQHCKFLTKQILQPIENRFEFHTLKQICNNFFLHEWVVARFSFIHRTLGDQMEELQILRQLANYQSLDYFEIFLQSESLFQRLYQEFLIQA